MACLCTVLLLFMILQYQQQLLSPNFLGELLRQLDEERYIVKASSGPRYVVGCRNKVKRDLLKPGLKCP